MLSSSPSLPAMEETLRVVKLKPTPLTPENFKPYGQVLGPTADGAAFGPDDAQLHLSAGIPRFYIMRLEQRALRFGTITHHASVTQCLGSAGGLSWYLGVAKPSILKNSNVGSIERKVEPVVESVLPASPSLEQSTKSDLCNSLENRSSSSSSPVLSRAGHYYIPPSPEEVQVFRVDGPQFLKLHIGTWHAGPLFKEQAMDFFNLELSDTNVVDHTTHSFKCDDKVIFAIDDE